MAASKLNYIVLYEGISQVYGCSSKKIAIESPPPAGVGQDKKKIYFIMNENSLMCFIKTHPNGNDFFYCFIINHAICEKKYIYDKN